MTKENLRSDVVVVGFGMVGHRFAQELAQRCPDTSITIINRETEDYAYDRVHLSLIHI
mgnify:FL=1